MLTEQRLSRLTSPESLPPIPFLVWVSRYPMGETWWSIDVFHPKRPQLSHQSCPFILVRKTTADELEVLSARRVAKKRSNSREPRLLWRTLTHRIPCRRSLGKRRRPACTTHAASNQHSDKVAGLRTDTRQDNDQNNR